MEAELNALMHLFSVTSAKIAINDVSLKLDSLYM